jgi:hypothetical protein
MHAFLDALPIIVGGTTVAILGGLADIAWRQRRNQQAQSQWHSDISRAVLGEPARQGVDKVLSLREQFAAINRKVESLSNRPAMNGGFQELMERSLRLEQGQTESREAAAAAARRAQAAEEHAEAALAAARQTDRRVEAMHLSNIERFNMIDRNLADAEIQRQTHLAALAEDYQINLPSTPTGELHGELHLTLKPETPSG